MSDYYYDPVHASAQATTSHTHLQHHHQLNPPQSASLSPPSKPQSVFADYHLQHPQLLHHGHQHQLLQNQHLQQLQQQQQQKQQQLLRHYRSNSSPQQLLNNQNNYHIASSSSSSPTPTPTFTMQAPPSTSPPLGGKPKATRRRRTVVKAEVADDPSDGSSSSGNNQTASPPVASANAPRYVQIKTKFPVARIKRIMQADEDVGKVAQVTPVVVNKALELFMISLCDKASEEARLRNSKRITAGHLKQAILHYEQFDFLADIIQKIADIPAPSAEGSNLTNNGSDSPEDVQPAKKTRRPRQKKAKDDDSF